MAKRVNDPFGFAGAVGKKSKGFFAALDMGGKYAKFTPVYSLEILNLYLADNKLTDKVIRIFPESEFERLTGRKP